MYLQQLLWEYEQCMVNYPAQGTRTRVMHELYSSGNILAIHYSNPCLTFLQQETRECVPFRLATPPAAFNFTHIPKGNLVPCTIPYRYTTTGCRSSCLIRGSITTQRESALHPLTHVLFIYLVNDT